MKTITIILISVLVSFHSLAQIAPQKYFIEFMDRFNSPYSITRPQEFLSIRSIERRQKQGIAIVQNDLPVNDTYVNELRKYNIGILTRSKWFNGVTINCLNPAIIDSINMLPFVKHVIKNVFTSKLYSYESIYKYRLEEASLEYLNHITIPANLSNNVNPIFNYGPSYNQIHMLQFLCSCQKL